MSDTQALRILIADDDPVVREVLIETLTAFGAVVTAEVNGEAAVKTAALAPFDVCLLDVEMPVMNGLEACRCLRAMAFTRHLPVLILTVLSDKETIDAAFEAGASDFLNKPVHGLLLWRRISNLLDLSSAALKSKQLDSVIQLSKMPINLDPPEES